MSAQKPHKKGFEALGSRERELDLVHTSKLGLDLVWAEFRFQLSTDLLGALCTHCPAIGSQTCAGVLGNMRNCYFYEFCLTA